MKPSMISFMNEIAKDDNKVFMRVLESQYSKFCFLYYMLKKNLKRVKTVEYDYRSKDSLDLLVVFTSRKSASNAYDDALEYIEDMDDSYSVDLSLDNKSIEISIIHEEGSCDTSPIDTD